MIAISDTKLKHQSLGSVCTRVCACVRGVPVCMCVVLWVCMSLHAVQLVMFIPNLSLCSLRWRGCGGPEAVPGPSCSVWYCVGSGPSCLAGTSTRRQS